MENASKTVDPDITLQIEKVNLVILLTVTVALHVDAIVTNVSLLKCSTIINAMMCVREKLSLNLTILVKIVSLTVIFAMTKKPVLNVLLQKYYILEIA